MKMKQLMSYSNKLIKCNRMKAFLVCLMYLASELFFFLAEAALYSIMLYLGKVTPAGLFTGENMLQQTVTLICTLLRYLTTAPLSFAAAYWFMQLCSESEKKKKTSLSKILLSAKIYGRSLMALVITKAIGFLFIIPTAFFGRTAYTLIKTGIEKSADINLLLAVHASVMTVISACFWIWSKLALSAIPCLMEHYSKKSVLSIARLSFIFMKGRRSTLLKLMFRCITPMLLIIPIPYFLPKLYASRSLFISISIREDEYIERNKAISQFGQASDSPKLSAWKKRRFTPSADKTQAAGYGHNT